MTTTDRFALPLLIAGQAQKEVTHNEALALIDFIVQPAVQSVAPTTIPIAPTLGQCWIVGIGATGDWAGHDGAIAGWTSGGWRFVVPLDGFVAWSVADQMFIRRSVGGWEFGVANVNHLNVRGIQVVGEQRPPISAPTGGTTTDSEARAAILAILAALRAHGLIAS